ELTFIIGRSAIASAQLTPAQALEVLGHQNLAQIEKGAAERKEARKESIKGELRGPTFYYRQATLPTDLAPSQDNVIERDSLSAQRYRPEPLPKSGRSVLEETETETTEISSSLEASPEARRLAQAPAIPDEITQRFMRVKNQFYFPDRSLAFVDDGSSLKAATENLEVIRSLVAIAQARGWGAIRVTGTENFRRLVWREGTRQGLTVRGYKPADVERAEAERSNSGEFRLELTKGRRTRHIAEAGNAVRR